VDTMLFRKDSCITLLSTKTVYNLIIVKSPRIRKELL